MLFLQTIPNLYVLQDSENKEWEERLSKEGHKVVSGVSKNTTILVTKDKESSSSKVKKAKELSIPILTPEEFETKMRWKEK